MLGQARIRGVLEYSLRECAGMLRRRMPGGTVLEVLAVSVVFLLLGVDAFVAHEGTLLLVIAALVALALALQSRRLRLVFSAAARRLERRNGSRRRPRLVGAREFVDAGADARVQRRFFPHPAKP